MNGFTESSGNVFADIGAVDADTAIAKAKMIIELKRIIESRGLTQDQVARLVGVDQPTISKILSGRLSSVTLDRLTRWLTVLGRNVALTPTNLPLAVPTQTNARKRTEGREGVQPASGEWYIEGYPNAERVAKFDVDAAHELADLRIHEADLNFCATVTQMLIDGRCGYDSLMTNSMFIAAVIKYVSCFKNSARKLLKAEEIYAGQVGAMECYQYFEDMRNKHVAHDVNSYSQSLTGLVLNPKGREPRVVEALSLVTSFSVDEVHTKSLFDLSSYALHQVRQMAEAKACEVVDLARKLSSEQLDRLPSLQVRVATAAEISKKRKR